MIRKGTMMLAVFSAVLIHAAESPAPQMLEPVDSSLTMRRLLYPADSRKRLAEHAVQKGFQLLQQENKLAEAQEEFNRAWRFQPEHYAAWWGAGIVRGRQASQPSLSASQQQQFLQECLLLLNMANQWVPESERANLHADRIRAYAIYGGWLSTNGNPSLGSLYSAWAALELEPLLQAAPADAKWLQLHAINSYQQRDYLRSEWALEQCRIPEWSPAVQAEQARAEDQRLRFRPVHRNNRVLRENLMAHIQKGLPLEDFAMPPEHQARCVDGDLYFVAPPSLILGQLDGVKKEPGDRPEFRITMTPQDREKFHALTQKNLNVLLAVELGNTLLCAPCVTVPIAGGAINLSIPERIKPETVQRLLLNPPKQ